MDAISQISRLNGVNTENYVKQSAYLVDTAAVTGLRATGTHTLVAVPAGEAVIGVKLIVRTAFASSGSATLTVSAKNGSSSAANLGSSIANASLVAKAVYDLRAAGGILSGDDNTTLIQMTVGTAAFTAGAFVLIVDTVPVNEFLVNG